ncbi:MAG: Ig-like domain repeat protein, partial [Streptosporangiaceae bacterium]
MTASHRRRPGPALRVAVVVCVSLASAAGVVAGTGSAAAAAVQARPHAPKAAAATAPIQGFSININDREDVRQFYNQVYTASNGVPEGWTGNIAGCNPGTVTPAFLQSVLRRINYYRTMAGEPDVTFNGTDAGTSADPNNAEAQAAALMESANNFLQHTPPQAGTNCWTQQAFNGSSSSNLNETPSTAAGATGPPGIDDLMQDSGAIGHRRNMLNPSIDVMGAGAVPATTGFQGTLAQLVLTTPLATRPPTRTPYIAWPPAGFVPYQVVYPVWSFGLPGANFSNASVSVKLNGTPVGTQVNCFDPTTPALLATNPACGQYGDPAISWSLSTVPVGSTWPKPAQDDTYAVTVSNVVVNGGAPQNFTYNVTVFDPAVSDPAHTLSQAPSGPASPAVGADPSYSITPLADPQVSGYQWETSPLSPENLIDDPATNGITNWTANVSAGLNPISTAEPTGATAFNLASNGASNCAAAPAQQTLTLNQTIFPGAGGQLSFGNLFSGMGFGATSDQTASVDVSTDGGSTWTSIWSQSPLPSESDTAFTPETVSLSQFANQQIQLRFSLTYTGGEWACGEQGWFFDNVSLAGVQAAGTPTLSAVSPSSSFTFNNSASGTVAIAARPQFTNASFGSAFLSWSPSLIVTSLAPTQSQTSLASSANPSTGGQQVTYTATVTNTDGGGTVTFTDGGNTIGDCPSAVALNASDQATCVTSYTFGGTHSIVATYSGDTNTLGSASPALSQVVSAPAATSGSLTQSAFSVNTGQPVTFTATVTPTDGGGTVDFGSLNPGTGNCTAVPLNAAGQAICTEIPTAPQTTLVNAVYSGDAGFAGGLLGTVQIKAFQQTTTAVTSSANPSAVSQQITYTATVSPANQDGQITFTDNGQDLANQNTDCVNLTPDASGTATCTWTYSAAGLHSIVASFDGFGLPDESSVSTPLIQAVGTFGATSTSVVSSANPGTTGQALTYTATVTGSDGGGTVSFYDSGNPVTGCQSVSLDASGDAACAQTYADTSPHAIVAVYSGDAGFAGSDSAQLNETVNIPLPGAVPDVAVTNLGNGVARVAFGAPAAPRRTASPAVTSDVTGYNVYDGTKPGQESTKLNSSRLLATATGYTVKGLKIGTTYYFTVKALNARGVGAPSKQVSTTAATAPGAPGSLAAKSGSGAATLTWKAPTSTGGSAITGYSIFKGTVKGGESATPVNAKPLPATTRSYTVTGLTDGTKYYFIVRAHNAVAVGAASGEASATPATVPSAPASLKATAGNASVKLAWTAPAFNDSGSAITG